MTAEGHRTLASGKLPGPLLQRLIEQYRTAPDSDVVVQAGYGRDAAAIAVSGEIVVKSDPITFATDAAARYLVAVNANDVACLGGTPRWMSVVLLMPPGVTEDAVERQFAELQEACDAAGIAIIGGHTEVTLAVNQPILIGTLIGTAGPAGPFVPGGAQIGDSLYLTKWAGIEGTSLLARERTSELTLAIGSELVSRGAKLLRSPGISVVAEALAFRDVAGVTAMHDPTEGGIATAVHELASAASLGAELLQEAVPVIPETRAICAALNLDPLGLLASGALLVAARPDAHDELVRAAHNARVPLTRIGSIVSLDEGVTMIGSNGRVPLKRFDADEVTRAL